MGIAHYLVYRASSIGGSGTVVGKTSKLFFSNGDLNPSTMYWYYVKAVDTSGNTGWRTGYQSGTTNALANAVTPQCNATEKTGRRFDVSWPDTGVYKYILERSINGGTWNWRGAMVDNNRRNYLFADNRNTPANSNVVYRLRTKAVNNNSPLKDPVNCSMTRLSTERHTTAKVNGRWEIIDTETGEVTRWEAVNVRSDQFQSKPLDSGDIQKLGFPFNAIRLSMHWDQLHTADGEFGANKQLVTRLKKVLDDARASNVDVILDPVHLGGDDRFWMPRWVWENNGFFGSQQNRSNSFQLLKSAELHQYLHWIMNESGLGNHPAVVAVEVVNEPHPDESKGAWRYEKQLDLMQAYRPMVNIIRQYRPELIVVLGAYYGGHLFDNGEQNSNAIADVFGNTPNLVWTAHNYFTGIEIPPEGPDYDGDGSLDEDGQGYRGARGAGIWSEGARTSGCYAQNLENVNPSQCNPSLPLRAKAIRGHARNAANHDRVAQQAGMPFFMGEFGMGRVRYLEALGRTIGWNGSKAFLCDKLRAYDDVKQDGSNVSISWAVWAFDSQVDGGFGLYDSVRNEWVPATSDPFFGRCP